MKLPRISEEQAFENIKPCVEVEDSIQEGESHEECYERLRNICSELFNKEVATSMEEESERKKKEWSNHYKKTMEHTEG